MTSFNYQVTEGDEHKRIDLLLTRLESSYSRSEIQRWITNGFVTVNGNKIKSNYKCEIDDQIHWNIPTEQKLDIKPENIPVHIVYEDEDLLVVHKPKGMVVHPTLSHPNGTLVNALLYHCEQLSMKAGEERPGIVHRLDKDTAGLLVVAKTDIAYTSLVEQLKTRKVERIYEAIVEGEMAHDTGLIDAPIGRDPSNRLRMSVVDQGKPAITHFKVVNQYDGYTHVVCQLETGRTHQIRVHMEYIGHPLVGDPKYTKKNRLKVKGQALFASKIAFTHPTKHEWMNFEVELPEDFIQLLTQIEKNA